MTALYPGTSVTGYNANPPPDDGTTVPTNLITWAGIKTKIGDPLDTFASAIDSNLTAAFGKTLDGAGVVSTAVNYAMTAADQGRLIYVTVAGKIVTTPDATVVNAPFVFAVLNNTTGNITLAGNATDTQTVDGATTVTIPAGAGAVVKTDGTNWFTYGQNWVNQQVIPQGRLTLVSGTPVMTADETAQTTVYYTPYNGNQISIPSGTKNITFAFSELSLALVSNHLASTLYDVFVFLDPADNTTIRLGTGPAWATNTAGSCARGTGASTTQLSRLGGLLTNTVAITLRNGSSTYSVAIESAAYVGTIFIDGSAGQVSCYVTAGQSRKWGVWNAYNREPITLQVHDGTSTWNNSATFPTFTAANANSANSFTSLCGLAEEEIYSEYHVYSTPVAAGRQGYCGIGFNSTTALSGVFGTGATGISGDFGGTIRGYYVNPPSLGINVFTAIESSLTSAAFEGVQSSLSSMQLIGRYRA